VTVAIAYSSSYLGALPVWLGGSEAQKLALVQPLKERAWLAFGLTEKAHGSDLLATEMQAIKCSAGYVLSGEKWLINNATRSDAITIFAKTDARGGARGFSLFLVEKEKGHKASYSHLPKVKTLGIRGADISGIRFDECLIPENALIGTPGLGFELTLKSLQITRTLCAAFSLGAANSALQTTLNFALDRHLYGEPIFAIPQVRQTLVDAFLDILICDSMAIAAARGLHVIPEQFSVCSSVIKYFIPMTIEKVIHELSIILGARYYLREEHDGGIFQKILRDNALISLFDGNSAANLYQIGLQLRSLALAFAKLKPDEQPSLCERLETIFFLEAPLPAFEPQQLALFSHGRDDVSQGLALTLSSLQSAYEEEGVTNECIKEIITLTTQLLAKIKRQHQEIIEVAKRHGRQHHKSPEIFDLAKKYGILYAAAACVHIWHHNRSHLDDFFSRGEWLVLALQRLINPSAKWREGEWASGRNDNGRLSVSDSPSSISNTYLENVAQEMLSRRQGNKLFSIIPLQLATETNMGAMQS
jgi:alkylation response protein AidB-like acyl-CoA dehydrogenase